MMSMSEYVSLRDVLFGPKKGDELDHNIALAKRLIMFVFWMLDLVVLFYRMQILKGSVSSVTKFQLSIYIVNLLLNLVLQGRRYRAADETVQTRRAQVVKDPAAVDKELSKALSRRKEAVIAMLKVACDMLSALEGSGIWRLLFKASINDALITVGSLISAFISLRSLFMH